MRATFVSVGLVAMASLAAFGCGASVPEIPVVSIAPGAVSLQAGGGQQQFTAVVDNATNTAVVWKVNGHMNGDAITGTISQKGMYSAPAAVPSGGTVTVEAVSAANANATASAVVKLTPPVAITLTPATATVAAGGTVQFEAAVTNTTNTSVTWAVNGTVGGDATNGTITTAGLYTAPATFPGNAQVTITATSVADTSVSATATVALTQAVAVTVTPASATVALGQSATFAAAVSGSADTTVIWSVDGVTGGNATLGTISTAGVFTAPAVVPSPDTETITATSHADNTKAATARVTIVLPVTVTVSPVTATVALGGTQQFQAKVSNATNTAVTWSVNGTAGGNATVGTITAQGGYTAPGAPPGTQTITVTAAAVADPTATATATVTLVVPIVVTISPTTATVNLGTPQQFQATVTGGNGSNTAVNWSVNGIAGGNTQLGTITATGTFTAPQTLPSPATETVTATSAADATKSASATVTLQVPTNTISLSPQNNTLTLAKAASGVVNLQVAVSAGFGNPITFAATGEPPNVTVTFAPATVTGNGTEAVTVETAPISLAVSGTPITITATSKDSSGNPIIQTATVGLTITGWAGQVSTLAGTPGGPGFEDGGGLNDELYPLALASDGGQNLFFADKRGEALRQLNLASGAVTTLIGNGPYTFTIGEGDGVAYDPNNGTVYVSDRQQQDIDAYSLGSGDQIHILAGTAGTAGNVDGTGAAARFYGPEGLAISPDFKTLYVADSSNHSIRAIDIASGAVTTVATGFCMPTGLAIDAAGVNLYVSQDGTGCDPEIKQVALSTGTVSVVAGSATQGQVDGDTSKATFDAPSGLAMDPHPGRQILYIADLNEIRALVLGSTQSNVYTVAGQFASGSADGSRTTATLYQPAGLTALTGPNGSTNLYVADSLNGVLRQISLDPSTLTSDSNIDSQVTTIAGQAPNRGRADGVGTGSDYSGISVAQFDQPEGIITDGKVAYVADSNNGAIREIDLASDTVSTIAGPGLGSTDGAGAQASFYENAGLALDAKNQILYIADSGNNLIRALNLATHQVTTVAGVRNTAGMVNGAPLASEFNHPFGILVSPDGTKLYVAEAGNEDIRLIDLTANTVTTLAGDYHRQGEVDGVGGAAEFSEPNGMAWSADGKTIYVSDFEGEAIRAVDPTTGAVTTIAGMSHTCGDVDGPVATATICDPTDLATDGRSLFWVEADTGQVRVMDLATNVVYTIGGLAGNPNQNVVMHQHDGALTEVKGELTGPIPYNAPFNAPFGIALDPGGNFILITNKNENTIRIIH